MNPDKTAIELWEKHSYPKKDPIHYRLMDQESFKIALSEAEGGRWRAIEDLAMLVRRMVVRLRNHEDIPGDQKLADQAMDYLRRIGLASGASILRNDPAPPKVKL